MKIKQIIIGIIFSLVLILLIFQQTMPGDSNNSKLNQSEDREQQKEPINQTWAENRSNATTLEKQPKPSNETRKKSNFTCAKPPVLCKCENFLSLNRPIITRSDLDDAIDLVLNKYQMRRENASIQIEENKKTGWYFIHIMDMTPPHNIHIFNIDNNTGDFWYLFGCI